MIEINTIGDIAFESLMSDQDFVIIGITARGFYTKSSSRWTLFFSAELSRSPLTVNLTAPSEFWAEITPGMQFGIEIGGLQFPDAIIHLTMSERKIWEVAPPDDTNLSDSHRFKNQKKLVDLIQSDNSDLELKRAILHALQSPPDPSVPLREDFLSYDEVTRWRVSIRTGQISALIELAEQLLGRGEGLTPIGDDIITGLMLSLNRWKSVFWTDDGLEKLNKIIIPLAYKRTTTLSANLIELACEGRSDERLIYVIDALMGSGKLSEEMLAAILQWGDSSGWAALLGFTLSI